MARLLMLNGASAQVKNALGETPMSLAKRCGNHELAMLLSEPPKQQQQYEQVESPMKREKQNIMLTQERTSSSFVRAR